MSKLARLRLAVLTLLIAGSVTGTSFALPNTYYSYWGYKPSNDNHLYSRENGANEPIPRNGGTAHHTQLPVHTTAYSVT